MRYGTLSTANPAVTPAMTTRIDPGKRILCIEDDPEMIELIRLILERRGFVVEGAEGGKAGLQAVLATLPDLVLLDLMMPDMDGWEVCQKMKADVATRHIPVIVVTASAQSIDREFGLHIARVDDYIVKPFSPKELLTSVDRVLGGSTGAVGDSARES
jgi:CheY-like chemotaxis protein